VNCHARRNTTDTLSQEYQAEDREDLSISVDRLRTASETNVSTADTFSFQEITVYT